jgi:hypothetical protein
VTNNLEQAFFCLILPADGSSTCEDDQATSCPEEAEDTKLKHQLLKKYGGYLGGLRREFSKRKKRGKLPKEARQTLLQWWELHYKWPYPSVRTPINLHLTLLRDQHNGAKEVNNAGTVRACTGDGEDGAGGGYRAGPEAGQQLVHQPAEAALEADTGGHAAVGDGDGGRLPRPAGAVRGQALHGRRHVPPAGVVMAYRPCVARHMHACDRHGGVATSQQLVPRSNRRLGCVVHAEL